MTFRWKISLAIFAIAFAVFGTFVAFFEDLLLFTLNPRIPYQAYQQPRAPNYTVESAWAALPDMKLSDGIDFKDSEIPSQVRNADIFYAHQTSYYKSEEWNGPTEDLEAQTIVEKIALPVEAGPFAAAGPIFAPRYRQATLYSFINKNVDSGPARTTAYRDVSRAFVRFLRDFNRNRPFILVGYGQGGLHVIRLLQEHVTGKYLQNRMVAAYVIDFALPLDLFDISLNTLRPCEHANDFECVVSWNELQYNLDPDEIKTKSLVWNLFGRLVSTRDRPLSCTNPLTWTNDELPAPNPLNSGGVVVDKKGRLGSPVPEITGAQCRDGVLYVDRPRDPRFRRLNWPTTRYRIKAFNLFHRNIKENAINRTRHWYESRDALSKRVTQSTSDAATDLGSPSAN